MENVNNNTNYNLQQLEENTMRKCVEENPELTLVEIAKLLGISDRTLYRKFKLYNIVWIPGKIYQSINFLENNGYQITKL